MFSRWRLVRSAQFLRAWRVFKRIDRSKRAYQHFLKTWRSYQNIQGWPDLCAQVTNNSSVHARYNLQALPVVHQVLNNNHNMPVMQKKQQVQLFYVLLFDDLSRYCVPIISDVDQVCAEYRRSIENYNTFLQALSRLVTDYHHSQAPVYTVVSSHNSHIFFNQLRQPMIHFHSEVQASQFRQALNAFQKIDHSVSGLNQFFAAWQAHLKNEFWQDHGAYPDTTQSLDQLFWSTRLEALLDTYMLKPLDLFNQYDQLRNGVHDFETFLSAIQQLANLYQAAKSDDPQGNAPLTADQMSCHASPFRPTAHAMSPQQYHVAIPVI